MSNVLRTSLFQRFSDSGDHLVRWSDLAGISSLQTFVKEVVQFHLAGEHSQLYYLRELSSFDAIGDVYINISNVTVNSAVVQAWSKICNDVRHRRCYAWYQGESERSKSNRL